MVTANSPKRNCARLVRKVAAAPAAPAAPVVLRVRIARDAHVAKDAHRVLTRNNQRSSDPRPAAS
jgi:hypothetical protein